MNRFHIWTIGCQMNKEESDKLSRSLVEMGYIPSNQLDECDIIVLNSCVVRQSAENRVIAKLQSLEHVKTSHSDLIIALTGCMVDSDGDSLKKHYPHVDLFMKPGEFSPLLELANNHTPNIKKIVNPEKSPTAFVTIIKGCDNFCSYCIVPYRRGREESRPPEEICTEIEYLVKSGVREITLLGQNVDSYGHDLPDTISLADLLRDVHSIKDLSRIRFLTSHPKDMSQQLIDAVGRLNKVCEHICLPVQSGDSDILKVMGRGYTTDYYYDLIQRIRKSIPGVAISTDVIVGFPGETKDQFFRTVQLLSDVRFDTVHVAAYSPRSGTRAARELADTIPSTEKKHRLRIIEELQETIATEINAQLLGQSVEVLVEGMRKGKWYGRTRTDKLVFFYSERDLTAQLITVEIQQTSPWSLQGLVQ